jgi:uncharacterized protein YaiL (DUF2058 family)
MNHVFAFMKNLNQDERVIRKNEEKLVLRCLDNISESKINAYPSAIQTLKGVSGDIVILEELAAIDPDVLYEVVLPLHQLDRCAFIGISTITTENNFFSKYLKMKDNNDEPLFTVKYVYLACEQCRRLNIAHKCNHNNILLPQWSSARKARVVKALMKGREDMLAREIGGVANSLYGKAFLKKRIDELRDAPRYEIDSRTDYPCYFIAVDPNAGGKNSHFAICTVLSHHGRYAIIGMESYPTKSAKDNHRIIIDHVNLLDESGLFDNSLKVFILEANLGFESEHISHVLADNVSNYIVMDGNPKSDRVGFTTTNEMKRLAVENLRTKLAEGSIAIASEKYMTCISQSYTTIVEMLLTQLSEFSEVIKEPKNPEFHQNPKKIYSGKHVGCDDLVMTLLFQTMWIPYFFNSPQYNRYL